MTFLGIILLIVHLNSFGNITRLTKDEVQKIEKHLVEFAGKTSSSGNPLPNLSKIKASNRLLIAKIDSWGMDRYFNFEMNLMLMKLSKP